MTGAFDKFKAVFLTVVMVLSVVAMSMAAGGTVAAANENATANDGSGNQASGNQATGNQATGNEATGNQDADDGDDGDDGGPTYEYASIEDIYDRDSVEGVNTGGGDSSAQLDTGSAKPLSISWYRSEGNGPYPTPPSEYNGEEGPGINLFTNAEGDAHLRVDDSIAQNPNSQWDILTLHAEASGLDELNPPEEGPDKGLVTQEFVENENWQVTVEQQDGDKVLDETQILDNQDGYNNPPGVENDTPPVMVFADTEEIEGDWSVDPEPDTGIYLWIDPNQAVLDENGEGARFEPGETYNVTFTINGETSTSTFEMVEGGMEIQEDQEIANRVGAWPEINSTLAGGTEVMIEVETPEGTQTQRAFVEGNEVLMDSDSAATSPEGPVVPETDSFDLSGMEGEEVTVRAYAKGPEGGLNDDNTRATHETSTLMGQQILTDEQTFEVADIIDPDYTMDDAEISEGKPLQLPYGITEESMASATGDGEVSWDDSVAYFETIDSDRKGWDHLVLHYEVSENVFTAIDRSPAGDIGGMNGKLHNSPLELQIEQTNADGEPKTFDIAANDSGLDVRLDRSRSDDRLYNDKQQGIFFHFDLTKAEFQQGGEPAELEPGENYTATLRADTEAGTVEETVNFSTLQAETWFGERGETAELQQSPTSTLTLNTEVAAGSELEVRVYDPDGDFEVVAEELVPTGDGPALAGKTPGSMPVGSVEVPVGTEDVEIGTELMVEAGLQEDPPGSGDDNWMLTREPVEIVSPPSAELSVSDQSGDGSTVTVDSVNLSDGGFVAIREGSAGGDAIGSTDYLEEGLHEDLEIELDDSLDEDSEIYVVAHQDTDGNQELNYPAADDPYTGDDGAVATSIQYTVEDAGDGDGEETPTDTPATDTPTDTPATDTPTDTPDTGDDDDTDTPTTTEDGPGFGILAGVMALLAAAFVLFRRE